jgi:hypothetical protein
MYVSPRVPTHLQPVPSSVAARAGGNVAPELAGKATQEGAPVFPRAPDLTELAARMEPPERARQLALALDGPGVPIQLKLATLRMMLEGPVLPMRAAPAAESLEMETKSEVGPVGPLVPSDGEPATNYVTAFDGGREAPPQPNASGGREVHGGGIQRAPSPAAGGRRGSVIPPTLAAHVQKGGPGTALPTEPRPHLDVKG